MTTHHVNGQDDNNTANGVYSTKVIFILIDGIGDTSITQLNHSTPLQYLHAHHRTTNFDKLAKHGLNGCIDPVLPGLACGSDTAHLSLLTYPPTHHYRGRGAFESLGAGLQMQAGDIAFKCNFASIDDQTDVVVRRRVDRAFDKWGVPLCAAINNLTLQSHPHIQIQCTHATEHRCGIVIRSVDADRPLTDNISGTDPLRDNLPLLHCTPTDPADKAAVHTCKVIDAFVVEMRRVLNQHTINTDRVKFGQQPANVILLRGCGQLISVPSFTSTHGMRACMVAPTCIIGGLGLSLQMDRLECTGATGDYNTDLHAKVDTVCSALFDTKHNTYDFAFLHVKAVDDAGHDKSVDRKLEWLGKVDDMLAYLYTAVPQNSNVLYVLTGDHSTPVLYGDHSCEPVPITVCPNAHRYKQMSDSTQQTDSSTLDELLRADTVGHFDEVACQRGVLGRFTGLQVMPLTKRIRQLMSTYAIK